MIVAVTGSTGHVGRMVARQLAESRVPQRFLVRGASRAPLHAAAEAVNFNGFDDFDGCLRALRGVDVAFMVSAAESPDRLHQHEQFIAAAVQAQVRQLVYTSFVGAAEQATFTFARDHWHTEELIRNTNLDYTFLRNSFYMDLLPSFADSDGVFRAPAGDGRVGAVARADVAAVAAAVLRDPAAHRNVSYDVTGPEAFTIQELADTVSQVTGREMRYQRQTIAEAYQSREHLGAESWQLDAWVSTYTAIANRELDVVTDNVEILSGRPAIRLPDMLRLL